MCLFLPPSFPCREKLCYGGLGAAGAEARMDGSPEPGVPPVGQASQSLAGQVVPPIQQVWLHSVLSPWFQERQARCLVPYCRPGHWSPPPVWRLRTRSRGLGGEAMPADTPANRMYVPEGARSEVLKWAHSSSLACHPGVRRTLALLSRRFWWSSCLVCSRLDPVFDPSPSNDHTSASPLGTSLRLPVYDPRLPNNHTSASRLGTTVFACQSSTHACPMTTPLPFVSDTSAYAYPSTTYACPSDPPLPVWHRCI